MKYKTLYLVLHTDRPVKDDAAKLRGYIGNRFSEYPILHHHAEKPIQTYPRVQYKIIGGTPSILGIEEGAEVLKKISGDIDEIVLSSSKYSIDQKVMYEKTQYIGPVNRQIQYRLTTPWLGLNSKNYSDSKNFTDWKNKKEFLNRIIVGNFLSMAKGLGIVVEQRLYVHSRFDSVQTKFKGLWMTGFTGEFRINFSIPDYFGIGKAVSQGFGTVHRSEKYSEPK